MSDQAEPTAIPAPTDKNQKQKNWGMGLIFLTLLLPFSVDLFSFFARNMSFALNKDQGEYALFIWLGLGALGSGLYANAKGKSGAWGLFGLIPFFGPLFLLIAIAIDDSLAKRSVRAILRHAIFVMVTIGGPGILAAISIPNFLNYGARAHQAEARTNLGGIYVAEKAFYEEHKRYGTFEEIGFMLPGTSSGTCSACRYTYRIETSGKPGTLISGSNGATPDNTNEPAGYSPTGFTATATGNLDNDPVLDQWHVNDQKQGLQRADEDDTQN